MLTATCFTCGAPKDQAHYADTNCPDCELARASAMKDFTEKNPDASNSDVLYAGRQALMQRSHSARRSFISPGAFSATRGMIPVPPQTDRGNPV